MMSSKNSLGTGVEIDVNVSGPEDNNDLKIALAKCWQESLQLDPSSQSDDPANRIENNNAAQFLVNKIASTTGLHLDLETLAKIKTCEALYKHCLASQNLMGDLMVPLRQGTHHTGLMCLHGVTYYQEIGIISPMGLPVYALMSQEHQTLVSNLSNGVDGTVDLDRLIETYYKMIRDLQPTGPYKLMGHSFGGVIAFEVAKRFRKEKEIVEKLFLVDVLLKDPLFPYTSQKFVKVFRLVRNREWRILGRTVIRVGEKIKRYGRYLFFSVKGSNSARSGKILSDMVKAKYRHVLHEYDPGNGLYDSPVILIRADKTKTISAATDHYGWKHAVSSQIEFIDLPGDHLSCVSQPNIRELAHYLKAM